MHEQFDVIIVGAGPAGSSCAYNLKRLNPNIKILIIDKATFPRYKPCGGGISPEVCNYLDFDLEEAINYRCHEAVLVANGKSTSTDMDDILMVRRDVFDDFLLNKAKECGVEILSPCEVIEIERSIQSTTINTAKGIFKSKFVVLAEGGRGKLARKMGIAPDNTVFAAMEYEHYTEALDDKLYINFDYNKGYAWSFPKSDGLSLGIGGLVKGKDKDSVGLPKRLKDFVQQFSVHKLAQQHVHGHPIQLYSGRQKLVHGPVLLAGEIAGCVDPLTAEGIRPAIKSGYLAAKVLAETIAHNQPHRLKKYDKLFHREIGKDFQYARVMSYLVYNHRDLILPFINSKRALEKFMQVFGGKSTYGEQISKKRIFKIIGKMALNFFRNPTPL